MKLFWSIISISVVCIVVALSLPYLVIEPDSHVIIIHGYEHVGSYIQPVLMLIILSISSLFRNRITAVISFSLCFGFFIYFITLSYILVPTMHPLDADLFYEFGFFLGITSAFLWWLAHLINVISVFRSVREKDAF